MSGATICNVNDGAAARYVITRMLSRAGFEVLECATGGEALECARKLRPDLMILDLKLPDIHGTEVCRQLKADPATASLAILQTSATFVSIEDKIHGLEHGADAFLAQPFTGQELVATVRSLLRLRERETAQLRRAEALAEADRRKDEFLAMLAHELRNPLAAVSTALAVLTRYPARDAIEGRARDIATRQSGQLARIVDDLLDVSRVMRGVTALQKERLDLAALLAQATDLTVDIPGHARRLSLDIPGAVAVDGDATRLLQIFSNLLDNAVKYTGAGDAIRVGLRADGDDAVVTVEDDGLGIEPAAQDSVFDLFYQADATTDRSQGGLGIGLTLVKALTELHGGRVRLRSEGRGRGTRVEVRLPRVTEASPPAAAPARLAPPAAPLRILLVEDNADARLALADLLALWGHDVVCAEDGPAGVTAALAERPDLAIIDIGLPGLDGHEVARRIHADPRGADITLVALSGYGTPEQREASRAANFTAHLVKPADAEQLTSLLASVRSRRTAGA
ncbi:MAG: response regulator [Myxococcales bacterium]|nr:response regulator [Myxococcales bacterium]